MENQKTPPIRSQLTSHRWLLGGLVCGVLVWSQPGWAQGPEADYGAILTARRPTPDPYFQPRIQEESKISNQDRPSPAWQPPASHASDQSEKPLPKPNNGPPVWEPPRTPVNPATALAGSDQSIIRPINQPPKNESEKRSLREVNGTKNYSADLSGLKLPLPTARDRGDRNNDRNNDRDNNRDNAGQAASPFQVLDGGQKIVNPHSTPSAQNSAFPSDNQVVDKTPSAVTTNEATDRLVDSPNANSYDADFSLPKVKPQSTTSALDAGLSFIDNQDRIADALSTVLPQETQTKNKNPIQSPPKQQESEDRGRPFEPTQLLALVGNEPIFLGDILYEANQLFDQFMPNAPQEIKDREMKKVIPNLLNKHIESTLLYVDTLNKLPEQVDVEMVLEQAGKEFDENAIKEMMQKLSARSPSELDAILRMQGTSLRKVRLAWAKEQITRFFLFQQISETGEVTHQQLLDEYNANRQQYHVPAKARWEEVMVRFSRTSSKAEAEQMIVDMGNKIIGGASLAAVAKKSSHGYTADNGGVHNWTTKGALIHEALDKAIFNEPIGELSEMIKTADGYHIIRVLERVEAHHRPFAEVQSEIKDRLTEQRRQKAFEEYINRVKEEIDVEYFYIQQD